MITVDASELSSSSRLPDIPDARTSDALERLTGADIMVSPLGMPVTERLLPRHLAANAVLINRKSFADMLSSIQTGSIKAILARMLAAGAKRTWQRCIMSTGHFGPDLETGKCKIGEPRQSKDGDTYVYQRGVPPQLPNYRAYATAARRIALRGGWYWNLTCDSEIPGALMDLERDLQELAKIEEVWPRVAKMYDLPDKDDPLQEPRLVTDWRASLVAMMQAAKNSGGVGPVRATSLRNAMLEYGADDTLFQALSTIVWQFYKVHGWGKITVRAVRNVLGVPEGFGIKLEATEGD